MALTIVRRTIGDITILDCAGKITIGEGEAIFRDALRELLARGRKKIILNYSQVSYQDSSGTAELVSAQFTALKIDGTVVLLNLQPKMRDLLEITKLHSIFPTFDNEASAIRYLESYHLHCLCPICWTRSTPALLDGPAWLPQTCTGSSCGAQFTVISSDPGSELIQSVRLTTYLGEYIEAVSGKPFQISIVGRLNLFASSALSKLWKALPRNVALFKLDRVTEMTPEGCEALLGLINQLGESEGARISLEGVSEQKAKLVPSGDLVWKDDASALQALAGRLIGRNFEWQARTVGPEVE